MSRQKGSTKYGGRTAGTPNRTSEEVRLALLKLFDDNLVQLQKDLKTMQPKDRAVLLVSLAKHITAPAMNPERLTEEQLLQIIKYIKDHERDS